MTIRFKNQAILCGMLLSVAAFSTPAFSADTMLSTGGYNKQFHKIEMMKMLDADGNHMVTADEFNKYYDTVFDELDKNHDGALDEQEWVGSKGQQKISLATGGYSSELRSLKMMKVMDTDSDHKVSKEEFTKFQQTVFATMDKSADKQLDPQEWLAKQTGNK